MSQVVDPRYAHKYVHLHIPKTGGSWVNDFFNTELEGYLLWHDHGSLSNLFPGNWAAWNMGLGPCKSGHPFFAIEFPGVGAAVGVKVVVDEIDKVYPGLWNEVVKFSTIRNPFDWLTSYYASGKDGFDDINLIHGIRSFDEFVEKFCDPDFRWYHAGLHKCMIYQALGPEGSLAVRYLLKMESMVEAVSAMLYNERTLSPDQSSALWKSFGTDHADRPAGNISPRKGRKDYRLFYTDKTRELAEKRFAPECALLGYDFDGPTDSAALLFNNEKADDCPGFDIDFRDRRRDACHFGSIATISVKKNSLTTVKLPPVT